MPKSILIWMENLCVLWLNKNRSFIDFFHTGSISKKSILLILFILLSSQITHAAITIQSISTTASTCGNNGTARVTATSTKANPALFYEIISGPYIAPIQNVPLFSSLFPGTYTIRVYDIDFTYKEQEFTIAGTYQLPDLTTAIVHPLCPGSSDGQITGAAIPEKGKIPFIWELISSSDTIKQATGIFNNLPVGNYSIKLTDACGNYQTRTAILLGNGTGLAHASDGVPTISKIGCDTMVYSMQIKLFKEKAKNPLVLTLSRNNGISVTKTLYAIPVDTVNYTPGLYSISDTIRNISYQDYLRGCLKDVCGYELCATKDSIAPFAFDIQFNTTYKSCTYKQTANVVPKSISGKPYMKTGFQPSLSLTLRNISTNALADSTGCNRNFCTLALKEEISGETFNLRITDGCGTIFQQDVLWPDPIIVPEKVQVSAGTGCLDSTAVAYFNLTNFASPVTINILSGPSSVSSTKPGYEFSYPISYPKTFFAGLSTRYAIKNMAAGTYTYSVTDTCGNILNGSFDITPSNLTNLFYSYTLTKGCSGDNVLRFNPVSASAAGILIKDIITNIELYKRIGRLAPDSLLSLAPGKYLLQIYYGNVPAYTTQPYNATLTDGNTDCWLLTDTIRVADNSNTTFQSNTSIFCNGVSYVEINVDSARGVAPYQYEISSGPKTFPLQYSNIFQLPTYGDYIIRIRDACGNSNARQISVDSAKFAPILKIGSSCRGNKIILKAISSSFFEYEWQKPNGTLYIGDSLIIAALSPADTGTYVITKYVSINSCTDTFRNTYHLELRDVYKQTFSFCEGTSVTIDSKFFTHSDIYIDTLQNNAGCDSIRIITLNMIPKKIDTTYRRICNGESALIGTIVYNTPGFYKDSVLNTLGCYDLKITNLDVNGFPDTIKTTICEGQQLFFNNRAYSVTGFYTDTLRSSFGCDSVIINDLTVVPLKRNTVIQSICDGQNITIGTHTYTESGTYIDTLSTLTCDSIVTLKLTVLKHDPVFSATELNHCFEEEPAILSVNWGVSFLWTPSGETTQSIEVLQEGIYTVAATDIYNCTYTAQIQVNEFCETKVFVPTGFTPNGDGLHDDVEIFGKNFTAFKITIFNRWGEEIFISTDRNIKWDGTYKGDLMPSGSYPWIINYQSSFDPEHTEQILKGSITLVR